MSCCTEYLSLGCYVSCGTLTLDHSATVSGTYSVVVEGGYSFNITGTIGEDLEIDLSNFNESGVSKFQVFDPTGAAIEITSGDTEYSCFKLTTSISYGVTSSTSETSECCEPITLELDGVSSRTILASEWAALGHTPSIEVQVKEGANYKIVIGNWEYVGMPTPTSIIVNIGAIPDDVWYIKMS